MIIDDYGHHPTENQSHARGGGKCLDRSADHRGFQPHRYTRVRDLFDDFVRCFNHATEVIVCPVYRAGERRSRAWTTTAWGLESSNTDIVACKVVENLDEATQVLSRDGTWRHRHHAWRRRCKPRVHGSGRSTAWPR